MKMFQKYLIYFLVIGVIPLIVLFGIVSMGNDKIINFNIQSRYMTINNSVNRFLQNEFETLQSIAEKYATNEELAEALATGNRDKVKEILVSGFEIFKVRKSKSTGNRRSKWNCFLQRTSSGRIRRQQKSSNRSKISSRRKRKRRI